MLKCTVGSYYYLLFVKETWIHRAEASLWTTPDSPQPQRPHNTALKQVCKMQDRMKTDGWVILIQYLKYRTQWCRCIFRCYLKEETEYLGIVSFIHKYYKFYIIWETILNIQDGLKEGVKADPLQGVMGAIHSFILELFIDSISCFRHKIDKFFPLKDLHSSEGKIEPPCNKKQASTWER